MIMIDFGTNKDKEGLADGVYGYSKRQVNGNSKLPVNISRRVRASANGTDYNFHFRLNLNIPTDHKNNGWCNLNLKEDHQSKIQKRLNNIPWHKNS